MKLTAYRMMIAILLLACTLNGVAQRQIVLADSTGLSALPLQSIDSIKTEPPRGLHIFLADSLPSTRVCPDSLLFNRTLSDTLIITFQNGHANI